MRPIFIRSRSLLIAIEMNPLIVAKAKASDRLFFGEGGGGGEGVGAEGWGEVGVMVVPVFLCH